jgi:hypothetical protein
VKAQLEFVADENGKFNILKLDQNRRVQKGKRVEQE